ncbi:MAG: HAD family phosphatase [Clostridia bacterium]|nr:HAD family phosphatase [Clostridia bacterium]
MNEGIRFDLAYETMPWDAVDAVIFDIGNVLIRFAPDDFIQQLFPGDEEKQQHMMKYVYNGKYWPCFDRGTVTYEEAATLLAKEAGGAYEDYMHALAGWIELKTPLEDGWRAARLCREKGKKIYLLSNYPKTGYERLREKFSDHFTGPSGELFDGGIISCYDHVIKPEMEIYQLLCDRYGIDKRRAVFIDDTLCNIEGANKFGMHGFHLHEKGMLDRFFI